MPHYVISYIGGDHPTSPEEGQKHLAAYKDWLNALGPAIVSPANPFKHTHTVGPDGSVIEGSSTQMSGYTIIDAESMDAALMAARSCPFLAINGTLEVSEVGSMPA